MDSIRTGARGRYKRTHSFGLPSLWWAMRCSLCALTVFGGLASAVFVVILHLSALADDVAMITERMRPEEIAARLMAGSMRSNVNVTVESEWGNEELSCTPIEMRGVFYNEAEQVVRRPRLQMQIGFEFGSAEISHSSLPLLENIATALKDPAIEEDRFVLLGHTDAVGSENYNRELSRRRATAVSEFLKARGVDAARLQRVGCGEAFLLTPGDPESDLNRRVEIVNAGRR